MADQLSLRGGTTAEHATFTGANKEVTVDTTKKTLVVNDGATVGGHPLMRENASNSALALGSAGTPSLKFTGDTNTGIYSPGADQLAVATNGTGRLFINSSGLVGVGVSSPATTLDVYGSLNIRDGFNLTWSGAYGANTPSIFGFTNSGSGYLAFAPAGSTSGEKVRIDASGRVGIGTSAPGTTLEVSAGGGSSPSLTGTGGNFAITQPGLLTSLEFGGYSSAPYGLWLQTKNKTGGSFPLILNPLGGAVGIGSSAPQAELNVAKTGGASTVYIESDAGNNATTSILRFGGASGRSASIQGFRGASSNIQNLDFYTYNTGDAFGMRLTPTGLGIGTTVPQNSLSIGSAAGGQIGLSLDWTGAGGPYAVAGLTADRSTGEIRQYAYTSFFPTFYSNGSERARIDTSGRLLVGTTTAFSGSGISPKVTISNTAGIGLIAIGNTDAGIVTQPAANTNYYPGFFLNSSSSGIGNISCTSSSTAYNTSSDYRLKENVVAVTDGISRLLQLKPSRFNFIVDPDHTVDGFIAHEVQAVVPEAIHGTKDEVDDDGNPVYQGIDQSKLVPLLTAALQEAIGEIESLKARLTAAGI